MAKVDYTGKFKHESNSHKRKKVTIQVTPETPNPKQQLWDSFIHETSIHVVAYTHWEITNEEFEFSDPPWDDIDELKRDLKRIRKIKNVSINNPATPRQVLSVETASPITIKETKKQIHDYFEGLYVKKSYNGSTLVVIAPKKHILQD